MAELAVVLDADEGQRRLRAGLERAAHGGGEAFRERALVAVEALARQQAALSCDDVWARLTREAAPAPRDHRALGPVMRIARGRGWIAPTTEFQLTAQPQRHRAPVRIWRSLVSQPQKGPTMATRKATNTRREPTQRAVLRCDRCKGVVHVRRGATNWEFDTACATCGATGTISWNHASPPPRFLGKPVQLDLVWTD